MVAKRSFLILCLFLICSLFGCSFFKKEPAPRVDKICEYYRSANAMTMQVVLSADFQDQISEYKVKYIHDKQKNDSIEIIEPEEVSDVKISVQQGKTEVVFDGARLETGNLNDRGLTPLNTIPRLIHQWSNGIVTESCLENRDGLDVILVVHEDERENLEYRTWFNASDYTPVYSEIYSEGKAAIYCEYEMFSIN